MDHYAGIDVSLECSSLCVVDHGGNIVRGRSSSASRRRARDRGVPIKPRLTALLERRYDAIVAQGLAFHESLPPLAGYGSQKRAKRRGREPRRTGHNLLLRFAARKEDTLRFLHDPAAPFSNNEAERDVRMMKLRQKVSGGFRSSESAAAFAAVRSVLATAESKAGTSSKRCSATRKSWRKRSA